MIDQAGKEFNLCFFDFITIELLGSIYLYCFNFMLFKFIIIIIANYLLN
jgi:hypothetical protein